MAATTAFRLTAPEPSEHELQISVTDMFWKVLLPDVCWTSIDHAHSLNRSLGRTGQPIGLIEAQKRKRRGIKAGIPDMLFWHRGQAFAIELKRDADSELSPDQRDFLKTLIAAEIEVSVCWTVSQVLAKIMQWGLCRPGVQVMA